MSASNAEKPIDAGTGHVCASFDPASAAWLSIGAPHSTHGFVELSGTPAFDEAHRGNPERTRAHRVRLADPRWAFLEIALDGARPRLNAITDDPRAPAWRGEGVRVETLVEPDAGAIGQAWELRPERAVTIRVQGRLDRPALAEITETDPPPLTGAVTRQHASGSSVVIESASLPARASVTLDGADVHWDSAAGMTVGTVTWPPGTRRLRCVVTVRLEPGVSAGPGAVLPRPRTGDRLVDRSLAYVRGCTALRTGPDERAIVTDHRLLPLSWTRDAYWQALALLAADDGGDRGRVADHLRWLFRRCDRPDGWWARSHYADGRRKDLAFQADQQLYPLLELAEYWDLTGTVPEGVDWSAAVIRAWHASEVHVDDRVGLLASGENAADDPALHPFIGAAQILRWWTAVRLAHLARSGALELDHRAFLTASRAARASFARAFERGGDPWPYAVDAEGRREAYHDANDLPVALAPAWGFCAASDPGWRATMAFAFSPANRGWVAGGRPGLGSAHTDGAWTLGDLQAWIHARTIGDDAAAVAALTRLQQVALADGMLPEAYDPDSRVPVRIWFAWPGAALAALRMLGGPGPKLAARLGRQRIRCGR